MYADLVRFEENTDRILESNSELGQVLRRQKNLLEQLGVFGEITVRSGDVVPELLNELKRTDYDLIVSGSLPAKEKLRKYVMGDVAREIVNRAGIPVLVVRTSEKMKIGRIFKEFLGRLFQSPEKAARTN